MVFESVVADLLNRSLGDYVENLDRSQLKLGIWSGDVVLKNLRLKESALNELDLPIKTVSGSLSKLVLKIPWSNLYNAPVVVSIEGLYLLAVPNIGVKYNRQSEDTIARDVKRKLIRSYEESQQQANKTDAKDAKEDSFMEKLIAQIVKNVQVSVSSVHIRYEDELTTPGSPFALGVTLHSIVVESTNGKWEAAISSEDEKHIFKLVSLDSLAVYFNTNVQLFNHLSKEQHQEHFQRDVVTSANIPPGYDCLFGPISLQAKLRMNPKPELDNFQSAKVWLSVEMEQLLLGVSRRQYQDMMELLQSIERMTLATAYRKYRPAIAFKGNAADWWRFAYKCILNEIVRRRRRNWAWVHMKAYVEMGRKYHQAYKLKLTSKKLPNDVNVRIEDYEFKLDIVSIIAIRQRVELEVGQAKKIKDAKSNNGGWFSGWFSSGSDQESSQSAGTDIAHQLMEAMTSDERQKLYSAIDYQERGPAPNLPPEFEAVQMKFSLQKLTLAVTDDEVSMERRRVMQLNLDTVRACLCQRPATNAVKLNLDMREFSVDGIHRDDTAPVIVSTRAADSETLLTVMFESNPLDGLCDNRVHISSQPLEVVYHAETVDRLAKMFKPPSHVYLSQLQAAAMTKLQELKNTSALKMQYVIETHKILELKIDIMASRLLVPEYGDVSRRGRLLALVLGNLHVHSVPRKGEMRSVNQLAKAGSSNDQIYAQLSEQAYDWFNLELTNIEVVLATEKEARAGAMQSDWSPMRLVSPISLSLKFGKCLITDDPRLPIVKAALDVPLLELSFSDFRLVELAALADSIPSDAKAEVVELDTNANILPLKTSLSPADLAREQGGSSSSLKSSSEITDLLVSFSLAEFHVRLFSSSMGEDVRDNELACFSVLGLLCSMATRTHSMRLSSSIKDICLKSSGFRDPNGDEVMLVSCCDNRTPLLDFNYYSVDRIWSRNHPEPGRPDQRVVLVFNDMNVQLHQEAVCSLISLANQLGKQFSKSSTAAPVVSAPILGERTGSGNSKKEKKSVKRTHRTSDRVEMTLEASFSSLKLQFSTSQVWLMDTKVENLRVSMEACHDHTRIMTSLSQVNVVDRSSHSKRSSILSVSSDPAFKADVCTYRRLSDTDDSDFVDLELFLQMGGARLVFLNRFVADIMAFLAPFSSPQQALVEASQNAAGAAQNAVQSAYTHTFKVKLDVSMKAPLILVPQSSHSDSVLLADLGYMTIKNTLSVGRTSESGMLPVFDNINLNLDNVKLSRAQLGSDGVPLSEHSILAPVSFTLDVRRNLAAGWYRDEPEVAINAALGRFSVKLDNEAYAQIMNTLNGNLAESASPALQTASLPVFSTESSAAVEIAVPLQPAADVLELSLDESLNRTATITVKFRFNFDWSFVGIELCQSHGSSSYKAGHSLGKFGFHGLSVKGEMTSDGALECQVGLEDCILEDSRPNVRTQFPRLMHKVESNSDIASPGIISVMFTQTPDSDKHVEVTMRSMSLILFLPYFMTVGEFFSSGLPSDPPKRQLSRSNSVYPQRPTTLEIQASTPKEAPARSGRMVIHVVVERPDIAVVENLDDIHTRAVIFHAQVELRLQQVDDRSSIQGDLSKVRLFTCEYSPARRAATMNEIVNPFDVSLAGALTGENGTSLETHVSGINIHVNAAAINLLTSLSSSLGSPTTSGGDKDADADNLSDLTHLWETQLINCFDFWFLRSEMAEEMGVDALLPNVLLSPTRFQEVLVLKLSSLNITVEQTIGLRNVPLVLFETSMEARINNWSSNLFVQSVVLLEMGYFNSRLAVWEPIIERIERSDGGITKFLPLEVSLNVSKSNDVLSITSPQSSDSSTSLDEQVNLQLPAMTIGVSTKDPLQVTMTRTCMDVLIELQESMSSAMELSASPTKKTDAQLLVRNRLDDMITVVPCSSYTFRDERIDQVLLNPDAEVALFSTEGFVQPKAASSSVGLPGAGSHSIYLEIPTMNWTSDVPIMRAEPRFYRVKTSSFNGLDSVGIVVDIQAQNDCKIVTIRSFLEVENHLDVAANVYYMTSSGSELICDGVVEPGQILPLSLSATYSATTDLFFSTSGFSVSSKPFAWRQLLNSPTASTTLQCSSKSQGLSFCMLCEGESLSVLFEGSRSRTLASRTLRIHLRPFAVMNNLLPVELTCVCRDQSDWHRIQSGESRQLAFALPGQSISLRLDNYLDRSWASSRVLEADTDELTVWTFVSGDGEVSTEISLGMHTRTTNGSLHMSLYAPFWMINRTGMQLTYQAVGDEGKRTYHPADFADPILFSYKPKAFFSKKKASVCVEDSEFSDKFSLDTAGSSGAITCRGKDREYTISVQIQLSRSGLTRQVLFLSSIIVVNNAPYDIQLCESSAASWITAGRQSCVPVWPLGKGKRFRCRVVDTSDETTEFSYASTTQCLLRLSNVFGGVNVHVQVSEASTIITLDAYADGMATVRLINHTGACDVRYKQQGSENETVLKPGETRLYAWEQPAGERRLAWSCCDVKEKLNSLMRDEIDKFKGPEGDLYWVSFLDGRQRTLMFTCDMVAAIQGQNAVELERIDQQVTVDINGIGLSLVNNITACDILYVGITSSGIVWETQKSAGKRFQMMSPVDCGILEVAHNVYIDQLSANVQAQRLPVTLGNKMEVDFNRMMMLKPNRRHLRRTFRSGFWLQMCTSQHQRQLHAKLNRLQLDNQLIDCVFPVVLAPVPIPKSMASENMVKPFLEASIVERLAEHTAVTQFKYFKILVQEFHVKLDQGFLNALFEFLGGESMNQNTPELMKKDLDGAREPLHHKVAICSKQTERHFFDYLHFSPLKVHVSFSMTGGKGSSSSPQLTSGFLGLLLQSVGVTVTEIQDVIFKLAYFERDYEFLGQQELVSQVTAHYVGQAVKQLYVLVLGLDVIGNPFGLVVGLTDGVSDLFYEPVQGAIQGPGEFAEGLALGVKSLFSHTVGGTAGAVSRITGTLGKGIAALTMDDEYKKRRRELMSQQPSDLASGLAQSGRGLVMGVFDGVTGVVRKPIEGAQEGGALGFVKGVGIGVAGLFARPASGAVDFASGSLNAVRRSMDHEEVTRLRPARHFHADGVVRPYVRHEAEGAKILNDLEKGRYASTDQYLAHCVCSADRRQVLLATDFRVLLVSYKTLLGSWQVDWTYMLREMEERPSVTPKGLQFPLPASRSSFQGLFGKAATFKQITIPDSAVSAWMLVKVEEAMSQHEA